MCDPLSITSACITAISTAISVPAAIQQGKQAKATYEYQAKVAKKNAEIAQQNAGQERQSGIEEARLQRIKTLQTIGVQQTAMAANGIDIGSGTALDTIEDTAQMGELDALTTEYNSERNALNYEQQANNFLNQSNLDKMSAKNVSSASKINAISTGLNGIGSGLGSLGQVSGKWKNYKNTSKNTNSTPNQIVGSSPVYNAIKDYTSYTL